MSAAEENGDQLVAVRSGHPASGYAKAAALTAAAFAVSILLEPWIEPDFSPLFLGAVTLGARRWGMWPGVVSTILAAPALLTLYSPPHYLLQMASWDVALRLLSFVSTAALIIWLVQRFVDAERGLLESLAEGRTRDERLRVALRQSPVVVFHQDADLRYVWVYNPLPEHEGMSFLNKSDSDLFLPAEAAFLTRIKQGVLSSGNEVREEVTISSAGREPRILDLMIEPFKDCRGDTVGLLGTAVDITEQKRNEEYLRESGEQLRKLARHLHSAHESQRALTSREIHDNVSQILAALDLQLAAIAKLVEEGAEREDVCGRIRDIGAALSDTLATTERISAELRPSLLDNLGLASAIASEARAFEAQTGVTVAASPLETAALPAETSTAIFRIVQETLANIERQSGAALVSISLRKTFAGVVLQISHDGSGSGVEEATSQASLALLGMRERAGSVGGKITIQVGSGLGTTLWVEIPTCPEAAQER